jgi:hypothetical protein
LLDQIIRLSRLTAEKRFFLETLRPLEMLQRFHQNLWPVVDNVLLLQKLKVRLLLAEHRGSLLSAHDFPLDFPNEFDGFSFGV